MAWMIVSEESIDGPVLRQDRALMDTHWAYEQSIKDKILCAGSLRTDDGVTPIGGLLVLDVATRRQPWRCSMPIPPPRPACAAMSWCGAGTRQSSAARWVIDVVAPSPRGEVLY